MAATVAFAGTTFWSDSSTGVGVIERYRDQRAVRWIIEALPGDNGKIAKNVGQDPGRVSLALTYFATESALASIESSIDARIGSYGSLVIVSGGTETIANCILLGRSNARRQTVKLPNGNAVRVWQYQINFEVLA